MEREKCEENAFLDIKQFFGYNLFIYLFSVFWFSVFFLIYLFVCLFVFWCFWCFWYFEMGSLHFVSKY